MRYLAHSQNAEGDTQDLAEHLRNVAALAERHAAEFGAGPSGWWAGLLHDLGKYCPEFQARVRGTSRAFVEHAAQGAVIAARLRLADVAFAVQGHHSGLYFPDALKKAQTREDRTAGVGATVAQRADEALARARAELPELDAAVAPAFPPDWLRFDLHVRMLFSCLIDADRADAAWHDAGRPDRSAERPVSVTMAELRDRLSRHLKRFEAPEHDPDSHVNVARRRVLAQCEAAADLPPGIFSLTVPTGGGKTLASMAFALRHAASPHHGQARVIVVIPYLSIIEQTAKVLREALGDRQGDIVLEHHSGVLVEHRPAGGEQEEQEQDAGHVARRGAVENWDAPVIVTTSAQFFDSLFSNRPSACRKLHNVARSVIILDEVQTLPPRYVEPIVSVLAALTRDYGCTVVFSTATQPAFVGRDAQDAAARGLLPPGAVREIATDPGALFATLRRVDYDWQSPDERWGWQRVAGEMLSEGQALCIVNTREQARALYDTLRGIAPVPASVLHLSAAMCPAHRKQVLEDVRARLDPRSPQSCLLVSTQVVEAGVDVDFPLVLRAFGPADGIAQAAGRCNREGRLRDAEGGERRGRAVVFYPEDDRLPPGAYAAATQETRTLVRDAAPGTLALDQPATFGRYFERLYRTLNTDAKQIQQLRAHLNFREVGAKFRYIDDEGTGIVIPFDERARGMRDSLRAGPRPAREMFRMFRALQPYMVNLYEADLDIARRAGAIEELLDGALLVGGMEFYHDALGFTPGQMKPDLYVR